MLSAACEWIGDNGTGNFTQSGGTNGYSGQGGALYPAMYIGVHTGGSGTYNLTGGYLYMLYEVIGDAGTGTFTQSAERMRILGPPLRPPRRSRNLQS